MNKIDIANGLIFQHLNISKEEFKDRIIYQKKIYLLQSLGTNLGYLYNWYIRGPYSPGLTNYVYNNLDILLSMDFSKYKLSDTVVKNISKINKLEMLKPSSLNDVSWYELLASILYIHNNSKSWKIDDTNPKEEIDLLLKYKPQYNLEQCEYAYAQLKKEEFIN